MGHIYKNLWRSVAQIFKGKVQIWASLMLVICTLLISPSLAIADSLAAVDYTKQPAISVQVSLSNNANELKFTPDRLVFQAGKRYKLSLTNPSNLKHYFTAKDFADAIWTQNVVAGSVEIKGNIRELELRPNTSAEWTFVPIRAGVYELHCAIAGHTEAGMRGLITIQ